ncbi:DNA polymerase III subunit tau [archaeon HR06]|nr:DNA polymerase III subunit tau [archaeon HR06]
MQRLMWTEKYRPQKLSELVNQAVVKDRLMNLLKKPEDMPHLLFAGPPGTGKTTAALCIAKQILKDTWQDNTLELNASDERGIETVRERIKIFARYVDPRVPFRIIILDEADEMTSSAQTALRRIMEESSRICRFILICNYPSNIIEPIQSRTALFWFNPLKLEDVVGYLKEILKKEGIKNYSEEALTLIYEITKGDLRQAINFLQAASTLGDINEDNVRKISGLSGKTKVNEVINLALNGKLKEAREMFIELTRVYGIPEKDFLKYAGDYLLNSNLNNMDEVIRILAEYDYRLIMGANPEIQIMALLAELQRLGRGRIKNEST